MFWSQKEAAKRYRQGGLAAVYPTVYGEGGIYAQAGADQPVDRWAPSRRVLNAQVKNGVLSKEDYEEAWPRAVGVGRRIRKFP